MESLMRAGLEGFAGDLRGMGVTLQQRVLSFTWVYMGEVIWPHSTALWNLFSDGPDAGVPAAPGHCCRELL